MKRTLGDLLHKGLVTDGNQQVLIDLRAYEERSSCKVVLESPVLESIQPELKMRESFNEIAARGMQVFQLSKLVLTSRCANIAALCNAPAPK